MRKPPGADANPAASKGFVQRGSAGYSYGERVTDLGGTARGQRTTLLQVARDGVLDTDRLGLVTEVAQEQGDGQDRGGGVGLALAGDVRGRAVHGLEHGRELAGGVDV